MDDVLCRQENEGGVRDGPDEQPIGNWTFILNQPPAKSYFSPQVFGFLLGSESGVERCGERGTGPAECGLNELCEISRGGTQRARRGEGEKVPIACEMPIDVTWGQFGQHRRTRHRQRRMRQAERREHVRLQRAGIRRAPRRAEGFS